MPGKRDQASHDAAIAKIAGVLPHSEFIRNHLAEVLNGVAFKGSRRSQEFLQHIVECALAGQWDRLKERSLGIDLFSRNPTYDTGGDSIVRVTASDVRKRLLQYYSEGPATQFLRIEIPAGSYIPEFPGLNQPVTAAVQEEASGPTPIDISQVAAIVPSSAGPRQGRTAAMLFLAVAFGCVLGLAAARFPSSSSVKAESRYGFYHDLLGSIATDPSDETAIALSNPRLVLYVGTNDQGIPSRPSTVTLPVPPGLEKLLDASANKLQDQYPFHFLTLADQDYTGMGEAIAAVNMSQLMRSLGRYPRLTESRFLPEDARRSVHAILLGAPQMSAWAGANRQSANFTMEREAITNARPLAGERQTYDHSVNGNLLEDYGLIWLARSPAGSRQLLMAGLTSAGTAGVSGFFCDPDRMRPVYEQLRAASNNGSIASEWQVLLHIHAKENVPLEVSFVSLRAGSTNR